MAECSKCGKKSMSFTCRYCGKKFCSEHRLPENHDCDGLEEGIEKEREESKKWFEQKDVKQETIQGEPKPARRPSLLNDIKTSFTESATNSIIAVTVLAFLLQISVNGFQELLLLYPDVQNLVAKPWTLLTVMLLHAGYFHLFANMITFYFFGSTVERVIGARKTLQFYVVSGLAASVGFVVFRNILFQLYGPTMGGMQTLGPAVGASGAVVAFLGVVAMLYPKAEVLLYFFIPMKIKTAVYAFGAIEVVNIAAKLAGVTLPLIGNFASSAHLTGLVFGLWYGKKLQEKYARNRSVLELFGH